MFLGKVKIINQIQVAPGTYRMTMRAEEVANAFQPGQFVHIRVSEEFNPILRRPFSIHRANKKTGRIEILYKVVGEGTRILSEKKRGDKLDILGPLGNGFKIEKNLDKAILVGGGMGVAPLLELAVSCQRQGINKIIVFLGAKAKGFILGEKEFKDLGVEVNGALKGLKCSIKVATEDGSYGYKGMVTRLFKEELKKEPHLAKNTQLFACGPSPMLRALARLSSRYHLPAQVSLEARMACGLGVCRGCVVRVKDKKAYYKRVCKDGPVFDLSEVIWE